MHETDAGARPPRPWETAPAAALPAEHFTPWELWAWEMIALGETADMTQFPQRGGRYWDQLTAEQRGSGVGVYDCWRSHDDAASAPTAEESHADVARVREREQQGFLAALPARPPDARWPVWQTLSARFLRTILFVEPWASARARPFVRIMSARILEPLDFQDQEVDGQMTFWRTRFEAGCHWLGLRVTRLLDLQGSCFTQGLAAEAMRIQGDLMMRNGTIFQADVSLLGTRVEGVFDASSSAFLGAFNADRLTVGSSVFMRGGARVSGQLRLVAADIASELNLSGSIFAGNADLRASRIGAEFLATRGTRFEGDLLMTRTHVGGNLELDGATCVGHFLAASLRVEGVASLSDGAQFGGNIRLQGMRAERDLQIYDGVFLSLVDLSNAHIGGELLVDAANVKPPRWGPQSRVILRNVTAGALQSSLDGWRIRDIEGKEPVERSHRGYVRRDLSGFSFGRLGGLAADESSSLADAPPEELLRWIEAGRPRGRFTPAPYIALASALDQTGDHAKSRAILRGLGRHEATCESWGRPHRKLVLALSGLLIGYGFGLWRAAVWLIALVIGFSVLGVWWDAAAAGEEFLAVALERGRAWTSFALDNAIPIVDIAPGNDGFLARRFPDGTPELMRAAFAAERVIGFAILSFLVAGLAGWAKRHGE